MIRYNDTVNVGRMSFFGQLSWPTKKTPEQRARKRKGPAGKGTN
jgi:hypothetical protein